MSTAENKVKAAVKARLAHYHVYPFIDADKYEHIAGTYYMPVAGPHAVLGVHDFVGCWNGKFFSIETKAPDNPKDETPHQGDFRVAVTRAGGISLTGVRDASAVDDLARLVSMSRGAAALLAILKDEP